MATIENVTINGETHEVSDTAARFTASHARHFVVYSVEEMQSLLVPEIGGGGKVTCEVITTSENCGTTSKLYEYNNGTWSIISKVDDGLRKWFNNNYIAFEDDVIEDIMLENFDTDNDGLITKEESTKSLNAGGLFRNITCPFTANDLEKFSGLVPSDQMFSGSTGFQLPFIWKNPTPPITGRLCRVFALELPQPINCPDLDIDLTGWNVSGVTSLSHYNEYNHNFFGFCNQKVSTVGTIDITGWDTSNVEHFWKFITYLNAYEIKGLEDLNTSKCWSFFGCICKLTIRKGSLDLSRWDISKMYNGPAGFQQFVNNVTVDSLDLHGWNLSNITHLWFPSGLNVLNLNISGWDTSHIEEFSCIKWCNRRLTQVDITEWDFSSATGIAIDIFSRYDNLPELNLVGGLTTEEVRTNNVKIFKNVSCSFDLAFPHWGYASQLAMFNGLKDLTGETGQTITIQPGYLELSEDDIKIATDKNWSILLKPM